MAGVAARGSSGGRRSGVKGAYPLGAGNAEELTAGAEPNRDPEVAAMMWSSGGWHWWAWVPMMLIMLGFWGVVVWVIVSLVRGTRSPNAVAGGNRSPTESAERILAERYARGDIDAAEYRQRLDELRGDPRQSRDTSAPPHG